MRLCLIILFQCILISSLLAQQSKISVLSSNRNNISIDVESVLLAGNFSLNYERSISGENVNYMQGFKFGLGGYYYNEVSFFGFGAGSSMSGGYICKINYWMCWNNSFELGLGFSLRTYEWIEGIGDPIYAQFKTHTGIKFWPIINIGRHSQMDYINYRVYLSAWGFGLSLGYVF